VLEVSCVHYIRQVKGVKLADIMFHLCVCAHGENKARDHQPRFRCQNVNRVTNARNGSEIHKEVELNSENKNLEMTYNIA